MFFILYRQYNAIEEVSALHFDLVCFCVPWSLLRNQSTILLRFSPGESNAYQQWITRAATSVSHQLSSRLSVSCKSRVYTHQGYSTSSNRLNYPIMNDEMKLWLFDTGEHSINYTPDLIRCVDWGIHYGLSLTELLSTYCPPRQIKVGCDVQMFDFWHQIGKKPTNCVRLCRCCPLDLPFGWSSTLDSIFMPRSAWILDPNYFRSSRSNYALHCSIRWDFKESATTKVNVSEFCDALLTSSFLLGKTNNCAKIGCVCRGQFIVHVQPRPFICY